MSVRECNEGNDWLDVKIGIRERERDLINDGKDLTNLTSESDIALQQITALNPSEGENKNLKDQEALSLSQESDLVRWFTQFLLNI